MPEFTGYLRTYSETPDYERALDITKQLVKVVERVLPVVCIDLRPYWKIPEYYGVTLNVEGDDLLQRIDALISSLGTSWTNIKSEPTECSAVWNASEKTSFCHPSVRWANLEIFLGTSVVRAKGR